MNFYRLWIIIRSGSATHPELFLARTTSHASYTLLTIFHDGFLSCIISHRLYWSRIFG